MIDYMVYNTILGIQLIKSRNSLIVIPFLAKFTH